MQRCACLTAMVAVLVVSMTSHLMADAWRFQQRSSCAETNEECSNVGGCCNRDDVCVTLHEELLDDTISVAPKMCQTIYRYPKSVARNGLCNDSRQCYDRCCQVYRGFRGTNYRCGSQVEGRMKHECVVQYF